MSVHSSEMIAGAVGLLELDIVPAIQMESAERGQITRNWLAVICHPHPLHGGSKDNKVVHTLCRAWRDTGIESIRFNFRGVGKSEGHFDHGRGELEDLQAVLAFAKSRFPERRQLILAGFSFGAYIAAQQASQMDAHENSFFILRQIILVAPPVFYDGFSLLKKFAAPVQVIQGSEDEVVDFELVKQWVMQAALQRNKISLEILTGASHFFHGRLAELKGLTQLPVQDLLSQDEACRFSQLQ